MLKTLSRICFLFLLFLGVVHAQNVLPQANLQVFPSTGTLGKPITFDGSFSQTGTGQTYGLEYRFKPSSRAEWTAFSRNPKLLYVPTQTGNFIVKMEVRNPVNGRSRTTIQTYRVRAQSNVKTARIKRLNDAPVRIGKEIFFEIVFSIPRNINARDIKTRWDFDSNGSYETNYLSQKIVSHVYTKGGRFTPTAEVWFPDGEKIKVRGIEALPAYNGQRRVPTNDREKIDVLRESIVAPVLSVSPGFRGYSENTTFRFDASKTRTTKNSWLEFHFDGESIVRNKKVVTRQFRGSGKHEVSVLHCFNRARPVCEETKMFVQIDEEPTDYRVNFTVQNLSNSVYQNSYDQNFFSFTRGDRIRFLAQLYESDRLAKNHEYRWDFDGDGVFDTPFSQNAFAETQYNQLGKFAPKVEVRNEFTGTTHSPVSHQKIIVIQNNSAPVGDFVVQQIMGRSAYSNLDKETIYEGERVSFLAKVHDRESSFDRIKVRFDLDGDGLWENNFESRKNMIWRYEKAGEYEARIQIQDHASTVKTIQKKIVVSAIPEPELKVKVSHKRGDLKTYFVFDARESVGHNLQFYWDIPGQAHQAQYSTPQKTVLFKTPGKKMISVKIVDSQGRAKSVSFPIFIKE